MWRLVGFAPHARYLLKSSFYSHSYLKRFDGVENVGEFRRGCWRYAGFIGVVNVVIFAVKQIQTLGVNAPFFVNSIADLRIEQYRRF